MTPGRLRLLLGIGAAAGLAAALSGVFSMSVQPGEDYIAIVDGEGLRRADYDRAM
ncbi:MAG: hypothetical protein ISN29_07840, partial [Gammaproteobacteria bacterium AqS3]|nr:hypothetical protein [Gammaproteobacteria bacterium AqS3]